MLLEMNELLMFQNILHITSWYSLLDEWINELKKKYHIYRITNVNSNRPYNLQCHDELTTNYYKVSKKE